MVVDATRLKETDPVLNESDVSSESISIKPERTGQEPSGIPGSRLGSGSALMKALRNGDIATPQAVF